MKRAYAAAFVLVVVLISGLGYALYSGNDTRDMRDTETIISSKSMRLTLAAPLVDDAYYSQYYEEILEFQIGYAERVIATGNDSVRILADKATIDAYADRLPAGIFVEEPMLDIWMRDFSLVNPIDPVQFVYTDASMSATEARATQSTFAGYLEREEVNYDSAPLVVDGGNIVDDYQGRVVTTTRFLEDNNLDISEGKMKLEATLGASEVAIIEPDDEVLAHADGMVAWIDDGVLAINDYSTLDPVFHSEILAELQNTFNDVRYVLIPVAFDGEEDTPDPGIGSACGIHLNLVSTPTTLYVPTFGMEHEAEALQKISDNTSKQVVEVPANGVCKFGGSARCTVWQQFL